MDDDYEFDDYDAPGYFLLTIPETLAALHISNSNFYRMVQRGTLRIIKLGYRTLVPVSEVRRLAGERPFFVEPKQVPELLTIPETAELLRIGTKLLYRLRLEGRICTVNLGARRVIPRREVDRLIDQVRDL